MAQNETQNKILNVAGLLFLERGYNGASLNDIVARAGMSKGGLFHYYPNKRAVAIAVLEQYFQIHVMDVLEHYFKEDSDGPELRDSFQAWLHNIYDECVKRKFSGGCLVGHFALEVSDHDPELRDVIKSMILAWENKLVSLMRFAASEGYVVLDPRSFARMIIAMYQGIMMGGKVHKDANRAGRDFKALLEFIERNIID